MLTRTAGIRARDATVKGISLMQCAALSSRVALSQRQPLWRASPLIVTVAVQAPQRPLASSTKPPQLIIASSSDLRCSFGEPEWSEESPSVPRERREEQWVQESSASPATSLSGPEWGFTQIWVPQQGQNQLQCQCGQQQPIVDALAVCEWRRARLDGVWDKEAQAPAGLAMGAPEYCESPRAAAAERQQRAPVHVEWEAEEEAAEEAEAEEEDDELLPAFSSCSAADDGSHEWCSSPRLSTGLFKLEQQPIAAQQAVERSIEAAVVSSGPKNKQPRRSLKSKIASQVKAVVRAVLRRQ